MNNFTIIRRIISNLLQIAAGIYIVLAIFDVVELTETAILALFAIIFFALGSVEPRKD